MKFVNLRRVPLNKTELWRLMLERGDTLTKLSQDIGLEKSTLSRLLKRGVVRFATVSKLAKFFGVESTTLIKDIP